MQENSKDIMQIVKSTLAAVAFSIIAVLIFAFVLKVAPLPDKVIKPVNQCLKVAAILFGALLFLRGQKGWLKGLVTGILTIMLTYITFSAIGGDFSFSWLALIELLFGAVAGLLSGVVAVNLKNG